MDSAAADDGGSKHPEKTKKMCLNQRQNLALSN
jgi:hypothetical protein